MLVDESLGQYMQQISESISDIVADFQNTDMTELTARQLSEPDIQDIDKKDDENTDKSAESVASDRSDTVTKDAGNSQTVELTDVNKTDDGIVNEKRSILTEGEAQPGSTEEGNLNGQTGENTFSQEQSKQGNSLDGNLVNDIAQVLTEAVSQNGEISDFDGDVQAADIVRQVVDEIKTNINDKVRSLELSLNPESLGRVQITVTTKNGVMQARIIAENEAAKNAIEGSIALLKESFNEQNLKVEEVEVMIANYDFFKEDNEAQNNENKQKNTSSGGNTETGNDDIVREELSDAEQLEKDMMQQSGNSVSYTV
jgi:flagellar hook-length control protein FliK